MPEVTYLSASPPLVSAPGADLSAAPTRRIRQAVATPGISPANLPQRAAVEAPKNMKPPSGFVAIRRALPPRLSAAWHRLIGRLTQRTREPSAPWTPSRGGSLSCLPLPRDDQPRVLAARVGDDGTAVLQWSKKRTHEEIELAKKEVMQLVKMEIHHLRNEPEILNSVRNLPEWIDKQVRLTPASIASTVKSLEASHTKAADAIRDRLQRCLVDPDWLLEERACWQPTST